MRKLPVFFLIDVSESMVGEPIEMVKQGMEYLVRTLKQNPYSLETVWLEIITFAGKSKILHPYEELPMFYPPTFKIGGGTSLSNGLECLMREMNKHVKRTTSHSKGDWKPLVFIFTDGQPTDDYAEVLSRWGNEYLAKAQVVACTLGECVSGDVLQKLAPQALKLEECSEDSFRSYFKWMTDSIVRSSVLVSEGNDNYNNDVTLVKEKGLQQINLEKVDVITSMPDDNYVVLIAACQNKEEKFLVKYQKAVEHEDGDFNNFDKVYRLVGSYKIDYAAYRELSEDKPRTVIDTKYLRGIPTCPWCGNTSVAVCKCGGIFCYNPNSVTQTCAWCGESGYFSVSEESLNIDRRLG